MINAFVREQSNLQQIVLLIWAPVWTLVTSAVNDPLDAKPLNRFSDDFFQCERSELRFYEESLP